MRHKIFLISIGIVFLALTAIFLFLPRSTFSALERRELATFPEFSFARLIDGSFTADVSTWFSDSEPYRDKFMEGHMRFKDLIGLHLGGDDAITIHADPAAQAEMPGVESVDDGRDIQAIDNINNDGTARIASRGIIVTGSGKNVRALMMYGGSSSGSSSYANIANKLNREFPGVTIYCVVVPTAIEYYCPEKVKDRTRSQLGTIRNIHSQLDPAVKAVDIYTALGRHSDEAIFLRTDHHWAPLGAYYAARQLATVAKVPVPDLSRFDKHVVHDFVGTMYGYSKDISVKNAPEDFIYYTPKNTNYTTSFIIYKVNKDMKVIGKSGPVNGAYFRHFKDGSGGAYSTFMGTDMATVKVTTDTHNGRKILIIKDSFGNAVPGYLFGSFEEVHVIDFRYFIGSLRDYIRRNGITDVALVFNIFNAYGGSPAAKIEAMLNGVGTTNVSPAADKSEKTNKSAPPASHDPAAKQTSEEPEAPQPANHTESPTEPTMLH